MNYHAENLQDVQTHIRRAAGLVRPDRRQPLGGAFRRRIGCPRILKRQPMNTQAKTEYKHDLARFQQTGEYNLRHLTQYLHFKATSSSQHSLIWPAHLALPALTQVEQILGASYSQASPGQFTMTSGGTHFGALAATFSVRGVDIVRTYLLN